MGGQASDTNPDEERELSGQNFQYRDNLSNRKRYNSSKIIPKKCGYDEKTISQYIKRLQHRSSDDELSNLTGSNHITSRDIMREEKEIRDVYEKIIRGFRVESEKKWLEEKSSSV